MRNCTRQQNLTSACNGLAGEPLLFSSELYESLHRQILSLPETLEFYPAHFSGSVCGAGMSGKPMSTLAFEKRWNPVLKLDRSEFVEKMTSGMLAKPRTWSQFSAPIRVGASS